MNQYDWFHLKKEATSLFLLLGLLLQPSPVFYFSQKYIEETVLLIIFKGAHAKAMNTPVTVLLNSGNNSSNACYEF